MCRLSMAKLASAAALQVLKADVPQAVQVIFQLPFLATALHEHHGSLKSVLSCADAAALTREPHSQ